MPFATQMDPEIVLLSQRQIPSRKRIQIKLFTKQKSSYRWRKQTWLLGSKGWGGINREIGVLYIR